MYDNDIVVTFLSYLSELHTEMFTDGKVYLRRSAKQPGIRGTREDYEGKRGEDRGMREGVSWWLE